MNVLIVILLAVACVLLWVIAFKRPRELSPDTQARFEAGLREQDGPWYEPLNAQMTTEELKEMRERRKKVWPAPLNAQIEKTQMMGRKLQRESRELANGRVYDTQHKKAEFLVPENLREDEKQLLRDFYGLE